MKAISRCRECPVGAASGVGQGTFCPLITRAYAAGEVLYRKGEPASYIWFIKSGVVGLGEQERAAECPEHRGPGSFVGLEALVRDEYDSTARVATAGSLCGATRSGFYQWLGPQSDRACVLVRDLLKVHD
jgi:CRP-like cAMP-binding protein